MCEYSGATNRRLLCQWRPAARQSPAATRFGQGAIDARLLRRDFESRRAALPGASAGRDEAGRRACCTGQTSASTSSACTDPALGTRSSSAAVHRRRSASCRADRRKARAFAGDIGPGAAFHAGAAPRSTSRRWPGIARQGAGLRAIARRLAAAMGRCHLAPRHACRSTIFEADGGRARLLDGSRPGFRQKSAILATAIRRYRAATSRQRRGVRRRHRPPRGCRAAAGRRDQLPYQRGEASTLGDADPATSAIDSPPIWRGLSPHSRARAPASHHRKRQQRHRS